MQIWDSVYLCSFNLNLNYFMEFSKFSQLSFQKLCLLRFKSFSNSEEEEMLKDFPLETSLSMAMIKSENKKKMLLSQPDRL